MAQPTTIDLQPAKWIWLPSQRTLANTFVLFRREFTPPTNVVAARGWISADSRYRLSVNGQRVQMGPAPADPRWPEADPFDLTALLQPGPNVLGVEVLYFGHGEGTWPCGKPGLLLRLALTGTDGDETLVVSDAEWRCTVNRARPPGQHRRWFLRALQEVFDANRHPFGWDTPDFDADDAWLPPLELRNPANKPALASGYPDYAHDAGLLSPSDAQLRERSIPLLDERVVPAKHLAAAHAVTWRQAPENWFDFRIPDSFELRDAQRCDEPEPISAPAVATTRDGYLLTYEFAEQIVGWPRFVIDAPAGTIVELMTQEAHDPQQSPWLDTHFFAWSRFICREGENEFEAFEFESLRWLQLHIRGNARPVTVRGVGARRRQFPWPNTPHVTCDEPALQRLFDAAVNTLHNCAQETCVDGMGRERQQYSGDGSHQLQAVRFTFGETRLPARFLTTFSQGLTPDGYFLDCWPAYDRLARVMQRQIGASYWGPLLDHGVGFAFDCWNHYWETGDRDSVREPTPRLRRFGDYLLSRIADDGLLPVENLGVPAVYIDHLAYQRQRHKQCAFNLYTAAMLRHALAPLVELFDDVDGARRFAKAGDELLAATVKRFWAPERRVFVANQPWLAEESAPRLCDRSLATALLFDQCPDAQNDAVLAALATPSEAVGLSYPANAIWRLAALAAHGRADVVVEELRQRWATMASVRENNAIQEFWTARPDSTEQWSHCASAPLNVLFTGLFGLTALTPGFRKIAIRPRLADLSRLDATAYLPPGPLRLLAEPCDGGHRVRIWTPTAQACELWLPVGGQCDEPLREEVGGLQCFALPPGAETTCFAPNRPADDGM